MSKQLQDLHILTAKATIAHKQYLAGMITKEEFTKKIDELDFHCHGDIVLDKKHAELECCYRESLDGILRLCHSENDKV